MLPPPTTTAISTPRSATVLIWAAMARIRSGSAPYSSGPIRASPESLSSTRSNLAVAGSPPFSATFPYSPIRKREKRRTTTFSPVLADSAARICSIVAPSCLSAFTWAWSSSTFSSSHFFMRPSAMRCCTCSGLPSPAACAANTFISASHVAAAAPLSVSAEDVPEDTREADMKVFAAQAAGEGKPEQVQQRIAEGRMKKWLEENVLLDQAHVNADKHDGATIEQMRAALSASTGENVVVRRFSRFRIGE